MKFAMRLLVLGVLLASGLTLVEASSSLGAAPAARAADVPGYVTLLVGRGMYGKMTGGRLDPQVLNAEQVAQRLQPLGLWAAGNVVTTRTAETTRIVHGGNSYASWADWQRLRSSHG